MTGTATLCTKLDPDFRWEGNTQGSDPARALSLLNSRLSDQQQVQLPEGAATPLRQKVLSRSLDSSEHEQHLQTLCHADRETLLSETRVGASGFLAAVPSNETGGAMEPAEFVEELKARLLVDELEAPEFCPLCDGVEDTKCRHSRGLCVAGPDRNLKHYSARNEVGRCAGRAALNPVLEKPGLLPPAPEDTSNRRRPADVLLPSWTGCTPAALDLACTSPHRQDALARTVQGGASAAEAYSEYKRSFLNTAEECSRQGMRFIPLVFEPSAAWAPDALRTLKEIARISALRSGSEESSAVGSLLQRLCVVIRTASARAVLRRRALAAPSGDDTLSAARLVMASALA